MLSQKNAKGKSGQFVNTILASSAMGQGEKIVSRQRLPRPVPCKQARAAKTPLAPEPWQLKGCARAGQGTDSARARRATAGSTWPAGHGKTLSHVEVRNQKAARDAKASGHLGNVGQDEFTADGLVKAAPRPPRRHTTSTFEYGSVPGCEHGPAQIGRAQDVIIRPCDRRRRGAERRAANNRASNAGDRVDFAPDPATP